MAHTAYAGSIRRKPAKHSPLFSPMIVFTTVAFTAIVFVAYILWPRWPGEPVSLNAPAMPVVIAGANFNVEPAAVRRPIQRRPGVYPRIDLSYLWPSLIPPDPALKPTPDNPIDPNERIFVTIASGETTFPMAERVKNIYPRYLAGTAETLKGGLTARAFRAGTAYQGEDLVTNDAGDFLARCSRKGVGNSGICLYERRVGEADVVVRFPRDWLADVPALADGLNRLFGKIVPAQK
jgi:hypothetical protein